MKNRTRSIGFIAAVCFLLIACRQQVATTATPRALGGGSVTRLPESTATQAATLTVTPTPLALRSFADEFARFSLEIPVDWSVSAPTQVALGALYQLGPEPLGPGPASSSFILVDTRHWDAQEVALQLECGSDCGQRQVALQPVTMGGYSGHKAIIGAESPTPLEWYFLAHSGRLVAFTLHDPVTLQTLEQVVASLSLGDPTPTPTLTATATSAPPATPTTTATPLPSQTPRPSSTPRATGPTETLIDFLESFTYDPTGEEALLYLSDELRQDVGEESGLLALLDIDLNFQRFEVAWRATEGSLVFYEVTLHYQDRDVQRQLGLIFENDEWRIAQIDHPSEPTPTPAERDSATATPES